MRSFGLKMRQKQVPSAGNIPESLSNLFLRNNCRLSQRLLNNANFLGGSFLGVFEEFFADPQKDSFRGFFWDVGPGGPGDSSK